MNRVDVLLARAQVGIALLMAAGFLGVIYVLIFYHGTLDDTSKTLLTGLAGVLGTIVTQQSGYFFARHRPNEAPEVPTPPQTAAKP